VRHVLAPFPAIFGVLTVVSIFQKILNKLESQVWRVVFAIVGVFITSLTVIRLLVFPNLANNDWTWLASLQHIFDIQGEQPHAELGLVLLTIFLWRTGHNLAVSAGDFTERQRSFYSYFGLLVAAIAISAGVDNQTHVDGNLAIIIPFFLICGLLGLSQTRLADVKARLNANNGTSVRTGLVWQLTSGFMSGLTTLLIAVSAIVFYTQSYANALSDLGSLWGNIVDLFSSGLLIIASPIINLLESLFSHRAHSNGTSITCPTPTASINSQPTPVAVATTPAPNCLPNQTTATGPIDRTTPIPTGTIQLIFVVVVTVLLIVLVTLLIARMRRVIATSAGIGFDEVHEDLRNDPVKPALVSLSIPEPVLDIPVQGSVRAAYRDFLQQSREIGFPRRSNETPREYRHRIARNTAVQPEYQDIVEDIATLTDAYNSERYGNAPVNPTHMQQVRAMTEKISQRLKRGSK